MKELLMLERMVRLFLEVLVIRKIIGFLEALHVEILR